MKRALITGVTGQEGSYLAEMLLEKGYEVFGGHRRNSAESTWRLEELGIAEDLRAVDLDLLEITNILRTMERVKPDEMYNLAAQSFVPRSFEQPLETYEINVIGTLHLLQALKPRCTVRRVTFHAITPEDVQAAFAHPRSVDMNLVNAQQARRVLDRLVGYQVSPLLWKSTGGKSAGRVQSVALRLVVEREREIRDFVPVEYWTIHADLAKQVDHKQHFLARLIQIGKEKVGVDQAIHLKTKTDAERVIADLKGAVYRVRDIKRARKSRKPWPPFTTSTLQQAASARLHMSPNGTMKIAQELYEGVDIGGGRPVGLITYMRADSTAISPEVQAATRQMIEQTLGSKYLPAAPPQYKTKVKNAQEAHEAIRPTDMMRRPQDVTRHLNPEQLRLYELIWKRALASQMQSAELEQIGADIASQDKAVTLRATGTSIVFDGFLRLYREDRDDASEDEEGERMLPPMREGEALRIQSLSLRQHGRTLYVSRGVAARGLAPPYC